MDNDGIGSPIPDHEFPARTNHMSDLMTMIRVLAFQTSTAGTEGPPYMFSVSFFDVANASMSGLRASSARVSERLPLDVRVLAAAARAKVRYVNPWVQIGHFTFGQAR
jgi:hypothetical protein